MALNSVFELRILTYLYELSLLQCTLRGGGDCTLHGHGDVGLKIKMKAINGIKAN